jgi:hypothetical protein
VFGPERRIKRFSAAFLLAQAEPIAFCFPAWRLVIAQLCFCLEASASIERAVAEAYR